jgi:hypothetical protein
MAGNHFSTQDRRKQFKCGGGGAQKKVQDITYQWRIYEIEKGDTIRQWFGGDG